MRRPCFFIPALIAALVFLQGVRAQDGASVSGVVEDQTGAAISKAKLTLTNKATAEARKTASDSEGRFSFQNVPPGRYSLNVEAPGHETAESAITVDAEPLPAIKVKMKISINEEMTITGSRPEPPISPERNADAIKLDDDLLRDLPTQSQNILSVIGNFVSPAAQSAGRLSIVLDGVESDNLNMPPGAIKRVLINKNPYAAEYSRPGKGRIEVTTRDGSHRHYHGSIAVSARSSIFDARHAFALVKPDLDRQLFEMNISGPFIGKRTTFFLSAERLQSDFSATVNALTLDGPFIKSLPTIEHHTNMLGRIDLRLNQVHTLTARYDFNDESENNREVGGFRLPEQAISASQRDDRFQLSERAISSANFLNEFRFVFERKNQRIGGPADNPMVVVIGAFTGGPSQVFREVRETTLEFQNITSYFRGSHTFRFGGRVRPRRIRATDASNFGGTFEFSSLGQFAIRSPFVFRINQGEPTVAFSQHLASGFFQDELQLRQDFRLTLGLRYDWQSNIFDRNNFAPRLAFAFAPGKQKTVLRGGAGIFYERLPETVVQRALLFDGAHIRELVISQPSFTDPFKTGQENVLLPSAVRKASDISAPYLIQASIGVEREIWSRTQLTVEYETLRGVHLLRSRNVNAPLPQTGLPLDPNFRNINQVESSATMRGNALVATFRTHIVKRLKAIAQYTLSRTTNDTSDPFALPANNFDLRPEMGRADFDRRHRFNLANVLELPRAFRVSSILALATGVPFNITTGSDDNRDTVANDRPSGVTRNTGRGPGLAQLDLRVAKLFHVPRLVHYPDHRSQNLEISIEAFNVLNRTNFINFIGVRTSSFFGRANSALPARTIQLSMRYSF